MPAIREVMDVNWVLAAASMFACILAGPVMGAEQRDAALWWDGAEEFESATLDNAMSASVSKPANIGGVAMPGVFLHPQSGEFSTAIYPKATISLKPGERLFFLGYAGIREGFDWDDEEHQPDGARFYVIADGEQIAKASLNTNPWVPLVAQIAAAGDEPVTVEPVITLATDEGPNGNSSYDWAVFGDPVLVSVSGEPIPSGSAVNGTGGVLVADVKGAGTLIVEGLNADGAPVADARATGQALTDGIAFVSFDFSPHTDCVQWRWRAEGTVADAAWGGSWSPLVNVTHLGPTSAAIFEGENAQVRVAVHNSGRGAVVPSHGATVTCAGQRKSLEFLAPGDTAAIRFSVDAEALEAGKVSCTAVCGEQERGLTWPAGRLVWPTLPNLPDARPEKAHVADLSDDYMLMENATCRWVVCKTIPGLGALTYVWTDGRWEPVGSAAPWIEVVDADGLPTRPDFAVFRSGEEPTGAHLSSETTMAGGLRCEVAADLADDSPVLKVSIEASAAEAVKLAALRGPAVHAGDRSTGTSKGIAIFPGLEYLDGEEASSSTRDLAPPLNERWTPHKFKVAMPLMMVETRAGGPVMGILWDPTQKWDGESIAPGATFASPDFLTHQDSHLMQLMLPSVPDGIPESALQAEEPVELTPGKPWQLTQYILAAKPEGDATLVLEWFDDLIGYPEAEEWARGFADEIALCRHGFMKTVWDEETQTTSHCVDWAGLNSPGHAALLLMDGLAVAEGKAKQEVLDRVDLIATKTLREQGPEALASRGGCHIMGWEFPYLWGGLPGAIGGMRSQARSALDTMEEDGAWGFYADARRAELGEAGARVVGICARNAYTLAKYAAITGDRQVLDGLTKALIKMRDFTVPRGAQGWECPILEPDVLGSAYAVRAYVWAYMATGDEQWLDDARFWARTGLPFQYTWDDGEHPGMRYASIPVFGSTFFKHSWIGLPVQWCGLVYAYGLQELMRFDDNDLWRRQVEGITSSATHQQWPMDNAKLAGSYPDSFGNWFTRRNGAYINPEDIELNLLALNGLDPGLRAVRVALDDEFVHVTAPADLEVNPVEGGLDIEAKFLPDEVVYLTVAPVRVSEYTRVMAGNDVLARGSDLPHGSAGWVHDEALAVMTIGVTCNSEGIARLSIEGVAPGRPAAPRKRNQWDFLAGAEGWQGANACVLSASGGVMTVRVTGEDPYAVSGPVAIDAKTQKKLRARVRLSHGDGVGFFWRSALSPGWASDKELAVPVEADGQWHEIVFDLSDHALWKGRILQIRLDVEPSGVPMGATLDVDWIRPE